MATVMSHTAATPKIWVVQYGPCWCRAAPATSGSFDMMRFRTAEVPEGAIDLDILIVSDRVIGGSTQLLRQVHDRVPDPKLIVATGHCPAAREFWDELPARWSPIEEVLEVDLLVASCVSGHPEALLAAVLGRVGAKTSRGPLPPTADRLRA